MVQMRRLAAGLIALLFPVAQVPLNGATAGLASLLTLTPTAYAESRQAVAGVAKAISVRIEGATQGSGILMKRMGNRYTVLTAWHVVSGHRPGEELDVYTPDGQKHSVEPGSIQNVGQVDMAVLSFTSANQYDVASIGDVQSVGSGDKIWVAGFPAGRGGRLENGAGKVVANASVSINQGYQLLYTNYTTSGMSGGAVLTSSGQLIGMHGRGEIDEELSRRAGEVVKTGVNQGIPISYYLQFANGLTVSSARTEAISSDDYLAQARSIFNEPGRDREIIRLTSLSLKSRESAEAYFLRGFSREATGETELASADLDRAIAIDPDYGLAIRYRGIVKEKLGNILGACQDWQKAAKLGMQDAGLWHRNQCLKLR